MTNMPENEEPGFETDVNELPAEQDGVSEDTLEEDPSPDKGQASEMEQAQEEAAEERKEGGYQ